MFKIMLLVLVCVVFFIGENGSQFINGVCQGYGRFVQVNSNCKRYTLCRRTAIGLVASNMTCPTTTMFNQTSQQCVRNYVCPDAACVDLLDQVPDPNSSDCTSYIICEYDADGALTQANVRYCAPGEFFDPDTSQCSSEYVCPQ